MNDTSEKFEQWCVVEVMGHRQFAGFVTEQTLGGASFVRVDVPAVQTDGRELPAFTKLLGAGSIYAISPCTEETARAFAAQARQRAFHEYEAPRLAAPNSQSSPHCSLCGMDAEDCDCEPLVSENVFD